jgi:apolipoprotein D and lipocalin family protein
MTKLVTSTLLIMLASCATNGVSTLQPPDVVPHVDLNRYTGTWYEIASFRQHFQKGCTNTKAVYRLRDDGKIDVLNSCLRNGKTDTAKGKAWVVDKATNAKLKVSFFWPFRGDYWIIELGKDYDYAVVAAPSMQYLWILSRSPKMDEPRYLGIVGWLKEQGFDVTRLKRTEQGSRLDR